MKKFIFLFVIVIAIVFSIFNLGFALAWTQDANGWTILTPSTGNADPLLNTKVVYVSFSDGNDNVCTGLSSTPYNPSGPQTTNGQSCPEKTINSGVLLLRSGSPDHLLLKKGDTWANEVFPGWAKNGKSFDEPMVISSYGTGPRPRVNSSTQPGFRTGGSDIVTNLNIIGIHFLRSGDIGSIQFTQSFNNILIEDCYLENGLGTTTAGYYGHLFIRRNVIVDAIAQTTNRQGIYLDFMDANVTIEENVIDNNGYIDYLGTIGPSGVIQHNIYLQKDQVARFIIRNNIISRGPLMGIQARSGGIIENNLFVNNSIGIYINLDDQGNLRTNSPDRIKAIVKENVVLNGRDVHKLGNETYLERAWGILVEGINQSRGWGANISRNLIVEDNGESSRTSLSAGTGPIGIFIQSPYDRVTQTNLAVSNVSIEKNIVYNWRTPLAFSGYPGSLIYNISVRENIFKTLDNSRPIIRVSNSVGPYNVYKFGNFSGNTYYSTLLNTNSWFDIYYNNVHHYMNFANWIVESLDTNSNTNDIQFVDPTRNILSYQTSIGETPSIDVFYAKIRNQSKDNWDERYTASFINNYFRAGFTETSTSGQTCGNGLVEGTETCDGANYGGTLGIGTIACSAYSSNYISGNLQCTSCQIDTSACVTSPPGGSPGGGGGGGNTGDDAQVITYNSTRLNLIGRIVKNDGVIPCNNCAVTVYFLNYTSSNFTDSSGNFRVVFSNVEINSGMNFFRFDVNTESGVISFNKEIRI